MIKNIFSQKNSVKAYIILVISITWFITGILFINPATGVKNFTILMFIPALLAIVFNKVQHNDRKESIMERVRGTNPKSLLFSIFYPIIFIILCGIIVQITGLGKLNVHGSPSLKAVGDFIWALIISIAAAWGEEYGWRGYLLPKLTKQHGKVKATALVGIVWGMYHIPAVFLLAKITGVGNPILICFIQFAAVFAISFPASYCYYSAGSLVPAIFLHGVWNVVSVAILGDIYKNTPGIITGNILYISAEGVLGTILSVILIFWFIKQFNKSDAIGLEINVGNVKE